MKLPLSIASALRAWLAGGLGTGLNPLARWSVLRPTAATLIVSVLAMALSPLAQALQGADQHARPSAAPGAETQYRRLLEAHTEPALAGAPAAAPASEALGEAGAAIAQRLENELAAFQRAGVDPALIERQEKLLADFQRRHRALLEASRAGQPGALQALLASPEFRGPERAPKAQQWRQLPWRTHEAQARPPLTDGASLRAKLSGPRAKLSPPTDKALAAPTPADLAPTLEVAFTPALQAKAQELGHNPHKIFQWVHDHIHFLPTYGSAQGAQDTFDKRAGNAFDIASLTLALLRASNIPARYVYGVIDVPAEKVMNWVGGAQTVSAAQQILSQGGVPNVALTQAGKIHALRLEHVWVEAFIDYHPARGAKHVGGVSEGDTWVAMDPAFKQYRFNPGMDLEQLVPFDAQAFLDAAKEGATINETEGWVQNLNQSKVQDALNAYQAKLKAAIDAQKPNATVGEVLGIIAADPDKLPYLSGSSPYTIKTLATRMSELPDSLRHHFRYRLFLDDFAYRNDSPSLTYQAPTAALAGKKLTLAWVAATEDDQKAIEALLPKPHPDGSPIQPEELPQGLPASIRLKLEIRVNGETKATGPALTAGSEPIGAGAFTNYFDLTTWDETADLLVAGQQTALGLSVQGVSKTQLETLKTRLEETKAKLEAAQAAPENQRAALLQGLTAEHLTGDMLTANIWSYFAALQGQGFLASTQAALFDRPGMSYGLFHAMATPSKLYGQFTTGVKFQGVMMDIGHLRHLRWVKNDDPSAEINSNPTLTANGKTAAHNRWVAYNRMRGQYASALEGGIPERMFIDTSKCNAPGTATPDPHKPVCPQAISAAIAIAIAQARGQKIFTITAKNADKAIPMLQHRGSVIEEIRSAIAAGKEVTIHEKAITESGWSGAGYAVVDPETGAGAYLIEGGARGAWFSGLFAGIGVGATVTVIALIAATPAVLAGAAGTMMAIGIAVILGIHALLIQAALLQHFVLKPMTQAEKECFWGGFFAGLGYIAVAGAIAAAAVGATTAVIVDAMAAAFATYADHEISNSSRPQCMAGG